MQYKQMTDCVYLKACLIQNFRSILPNVPIVTELSPVRLVCGIIRTMVAARTRNLRYFKE